MARPIFFRAFSRILPELREQQPSENATALPMTPAPTTVIESVSVMVFPLPLHFVGFGDMLVQIYEVQTPEEAAALVRLGVDHIGVLVGDGMFPRELSIAQTNAIFAAVPAGKKRVALSLSADFEEVARVVRETRPDIIQLQAAIDDFSVAMTLALKTRLAHTLIMRAIPVIDQTSIETAASYQGVADFLLLDSWDPGTGQFGRSAALTIGA